MKGHGRMTKDDPIHLNVQDNVIYAHIIIGTALIAMVLLQIVLALIRPKPDQPLEVKSTKRPPTSIKTLWAIYHIDLGYSIVIIGIINCILGIIAFTKTFQKQLGIIYTKAFIAVFIIFVVLPTPIYILIMYKYPFNKKNDIKKEKNDKENEEKHNYDLHENTALSSKRIVKSKMVKSLRSRCFIQ